MSSELKDFVRLATTIITGLGVILCWSLCASCGPTCTHYGEQTWLADTPGVHQYVREWEQSARYLEDGMEYAGPITGAQLRQIVDETTACVEHVARPYAGKAHCHRQNERPCRECLKVLISSQWDWSCDGLEELLRVETPVWYNRDTGEYETSCTVYKGFEIDPACPCRYRGGSMRHDGKNLIVVTSNLRQLRYEIVRYWTGCWNPVFDTRLAACGAAEDL